MISVVMGTYQSAPTLERACRSILDGDYKDLELIVVDDGSTDDTPAILQELSGDDRVVAIRLESNHGLTYCLNLALSKAKGEYIARMDADDYSHPTRLGEELAFLQANPQLGFVSCAVGLEADGVVWGARSFPALPDRNDLMSGNPFVHPAMLFRKEALEAVDGYRDLDTTRRCEDYDLVLRLWGKGIRGGNMPQVLLDYHEAKDSSSRHTSRTRRNEYWVRKEAAKALGWGLKGRLKAYKPLLLLLLPKPLYRYFHLRKHKKEKKTLA